MQGKDGEIAQVFFLRIKLWTFEASICIAGISKNSLHARCPAQLKTLNISSQDMSRHAGELKMTSD